MLVEVITVLISPLIRIAERLAPSLYERIVGQAVKYGDSITLTHVNTGHSLHSHGINYSHSGSSGQQQITAYSGSDSNDLWLVKAQDGLPADYYTERPIRHGNIIRLEHIQTKRNLHSHGGIPSPLTGQQEVSAYGDMGEGDFNDNWKVEVRGGGVWYEKKRVRLIHVDTGGALHSHAGHSHPQFTAGQQEVTCYKGRDDNDFWVVQT